MLLWTIWHSCKLFTARSLLQGHLLLLYCRMANFEALDFKGSGVSKSEKESGLNEYAKSLFDPSLTWKDVDWLMSVTRLPVILKGILSGKASCWAVGV